MQTHGPRLQVRNPRTGKEDYSFVAATPGDVAAAAQRLRNGQAAWGAMALEDRLDVMRRWAGNLERFAPAITAADSADTGFGDISRIAPGMLADAIRGICAAAPGQYQAMMRDGPSRLMADLSYETVLQPIPLVGVISPWNGPVWLSLLRSILPLAAGAAVLVKPSEITPRFVEPVRESYADIPELAAVFDFVLGAGDVGAALIESADFISFTGSVPTGRKVAEACGRQLIPVEIELGGKDPLIVTAKADLGRAVSAAVRGAIHSTGQVCFALERVYVERPLHDAFVAALVARCEEIALNYPDPLSGHIGPFIHAPQAGIVDAQIDDALARGARIATGGKTQNLGGGLYMRPTVLVDVDHAMDVMRDETFGPVIPVMAYDGADEAVRLANDTVFGLSAAVIGGDVDEARAIARRLNAGNISVQDACLTFAAGPGEADSFGVSGLGGKRSGIQRYIKRKALLVHRGAAACLTGPRAAAE